MQFMQFNNDHFLLAAFFSLALHTLVFSLATNNQVRLIDKPDTPEAREKIVFLAVLPPKPAKNFPAPVHRRFAEVGHF